MSSTKTHFVESKQMESMIPNPSAPPDNETSVQVPPSYNEAMSSLNSASQHLFPPYPVTESSTPRPVTETPTAPYPDNETFMPTVDASPTSSVYDLQQQQSSTGFYGVSSQPHQYETVVCQPDAYIKKYVHPKTYVVLQDQRGYQQDCCTCTNWFWFWYTCVEVTNCVCDCIRVTIACIECLDASE